MAFVHLQRRWTQQPQVPVEVRPEFVNYGLRNAYLFTAANQYKDLITRSQPTFGAAAIKTAGYVETAASATGWITLPIAGFSGAPVSFLIRQYVLSGNIAWSALRPNTDGWYGYYGSGAGKNGICWLQNDWVLTANLTVSIPGMQTCAAADAGSRAMAAISGVGVLNDTSYTAISGYTFTSANLGCVPLVPAHETAARFELFCLFSKVLPEALLKELSVNPWQIFKPIRQVLYFDFGAPASYTLAGEAGAYALSGAPAGLMVARLLALEVGAYALSGAPAGLMVARLLTGEAGAYSVTGTAATLTYTPLGSYTLTCSSGTYALTGQDAQLLASRLVQGQVGTFALSGVSAGLMVARLLALEVGAYALSGAPAGLMVARLLTGEAGAYSVTGTAATLTYTPLGQYVLACESGAYALTGSTAQLLAGRVLQGQVGTFALSGPDALLIRSLLLTMETGSFTASGRDAQLLAARVLACATGGLSVTGFDAGLNRGYTLTLEPGAVSYSGMPAELIASRVLQGECGVYATLGSPAALIYSGEHRGIAPYSQVTLRFVDQSIVFQIVPETLTFRLN